MNTEANSDEILNLDYNFSKLVCRALNRMSGNNRRACLLLGISERTIYMYRAQFNIRNDGYGWHAKEFWATIEEEYGKSVNKKEGQEIGSIVN